MQTLTDNMKTQHF